MVFTTNFSKWKWCRVDFCRPKWSLRRDRRPSIISRGQYALYHCSPGLLWPRRGRYPFFCLLRPDGSYVLAVATTQSRFILLQYGRTPYWPLYVSIRARVVRILDLLLRLRPILASFQDNKKMCPISASKAHLSVVSTEDNWRIFAICGFSALGHYWLTTAR